MADIDPAHHVVRHIKSTWVDGDFIEPAAFRLRKNEQSGGFEDGLSVNWIEYFQKPAPQEAVAPLVEILEKKGRKIGGESRFALLNVGATTAAAAMYTRITIVLDTEPDDPSHALVKGYEAYNDQVAEEFAKAVITTYRAKPPKS